MPDGQHRSLRQHSSSFCCSLGMHHDNGTQEYYVSGMNTKARNTSGENFTHVLNITGLGDITEYLDLLRFLERTNFLFLDRDIHGRTIAHKFFETAKLKEIGKGQLEEIFLRLRVDFSAVGNLGYDFALKGLISSWASASELDENGVKAKEMLPLLFSRYHDRRYQKVDYRSMLLSSNGIIKGFAGIVKKKSLAKWVNINGDTSLIALVKYWPETEDELPLLNMVPSRVGFKSRF